MSRLIDCPFCEGAANVSQRLVGEGYDDCVFSVFRAECRCGAMTKWCDSKTAVVDIWNKRDGFDQEPSEAQQGLIPIPDGYAEQ